MIGTLQGQSPDPRGEGGRILSSRNRVGRAGMTQNKRCPESRGGSASFDEACVSPTTP
jgi:hypothetical protein